MSSMNLTEELLLLEQELKSKCSLSFLESLARETGMIQRARKCKAQEILNKKDSIIIKPPIGAGDKGVSKLDTEDNVEVFIKEDTIINYTIMLAPIDEPQKINY